ncbi:MAG: hypothetical protein WCO53_13340 [Deltaproteobacteria bacterium]
MALLANLALFEIRAATEQTLDMPLAWPTEQKKTPAKRLTAFANKNICAGFASLAREDGSNLATICADILRVVDDDKMKKVDGDLLKAIVRVVRDGDYIDLKAFINKNREDYCLSDSRGVTLMDISSAIIAICAVIILVCKYLPSAEFRKLATEARRSLWARKLLDKGPFWTVRQGWSVAQIWTEAGKELSPKEQNSAIDFLGKAGLAYECIEPNKREPFDGKTMVRLPGDKQDFLWRVLVPGLRHNMVDIAKAQVECASPDYFALQATYKEPLTQVYNDLCREHDGQDISNMRHIKLEPDALREVTYKAESNQAIDTWLEHIIAAVPKMTLQPILDQSGVPYEEQKMETNSDLLIPAKARVTAVFHRGLKNGAGDILLPAKVEAIDPPDKEIS